MNNIFNYYQISPVLACCGQPREEQLVSLANEGYQVIINLGLAGGKYALKDEAGSVQRLGLAYHHIPVEFDDPKITDLASFITIMNRYAGQKTLVHCAANYRASCFTGLYLLYKGDMNEDSMTGLIEGIWQPDAIWEDFMDQGLEYIRLNGFT